MTHDQDTFLSAIPVTHETVIHRLTLYQEMIISFSERLNLVSKNSLPQIWTRHFLDSAQLMPFIPDTAQTLADMGSGAGFPGLVLAILAEDKSRPLSIHAIESTGKKADFLQAVVDELKLNVVVRRERIEEIKDFRADVITARALKPLPDLLKYANKLKKKESTFLFLKGQSVAEELTQARKYWTFEAESHQSLSDDSGRLLVLKNLGRNAKKK